MTTTLRLLGALALALAVSACSTLPADVAPATAGAAPPPPARPALAVAPAPPAPAAAAPAAIDSPIAALLAARPEVRARIVDPVHPEVPFDLDAPATHADLWQRIRQGYSLPALEDPLVERHERWFASRPDFMDRVVERGERFLFHIVEEVERRGLPLELALLPIVESAFNPLAVSPVQAAGIWQFMPATGRYFDLRQNLFRDERREVLASTEAALDYLTRLHRMFGDWDLALAAYNWGNGNVQRAIRRNRAAGLPTDYRSLRMPAETRNYVPKLRALANIIADPQRFGLTLRPLLNRPYFLAVPIERDIDVDLVVRLADITTEQFQQLNPQFNKPVILAAGTSKVLLPYGNAEAFVRRLASHDGALASWTAWTTPRTLRAADAARLAGVDADLLVRVNRIPPRMLIKSGSTLLVPRAAQQAADVSQRVADNGALRLAPEPAPARRVELRAGRNGETVAAVARRHGVSAANVARWNELPARARFAPGARIVVYLPPRAAATRSAARPAARSASAARATPQRQAAARRAQAPRQTAAAPRPAAPRPAATARPQPRQVAVTR